MKYNRHVLGSVSTHTAVVVLVAWGWVYWNCLTGLCFCAAAAWGWFFCFPLEGGVLVIFEVVAVIVILAWMLLWTELGSWWLFPRILAWI